MNRCQDDINRSKSLGASRAAEREFFGSRPEYAHVRARCGASSSGQSPLDLICCAFTHEHASQTTPPPHYACTRAGTYTHTRTGMQTLALALSTILAEHIRGLLPGLRSLVEGEAERRGAELRVLGDAPPGSSTAARCAFTWCSFNSFDPTTGGARFDSFRPLPDARPSAAVKCLALRLLWGIHSVRKH